MVFRDPRDVVISEYNMRRDYYHQDVVQGVSLDDFIARRFEVNPPTFRPSRRGDTLYTAIAAALAGVCIIWRSSCEVCYIVCMYIETLLGSHAIA